MISPFLLRALSSQMGPAPQGLPAASSQLAPVDMDDDSLQAALRQAQDAPGVSPGAAASPRVPTMRAEDPDFLRYQLQPLEDEASALQAALRQAQDFGQPQHGSFTNPWAAGLSALANVVRAGASKQKQEALGRELKDVNQRRQRLVTTAGHGPSALKPSASATKPQKSTDPASPESQRGQDIIRANLSDQYSEEEIARMTEADVSDILKYGSMKRRDEVSREAEVGKNKRFTAQQMQQARIHAENLGFKWADMDQEERLAWARIAESQATRDDAAAKDARGLSERNVGGFTFDPANPPSPDAAKKMADVSIQSKTIVGGLDSLERLYRTGGTEITGETSGTMAAEWKNLTDMLRNISNMGVPNGKDYEMLAMQLENPTELKSFLTSKERGLAQMKTVREQIARLVSATADAYKYKPGETKPVEPRKRPRTATGGPSAPPTKSAGAPPAATSPTAGERRQYSPSLNKTRVLDAAGNVLRVEEGDTRRGR